MNGPGNTPSARGPPQGWRRARPSPDSPCWGAGAQLAAQAGESSSCRPGLRGRRTGGAAPRTPPVPEALDARPSASQADGQGREAINPAHVAANPSPRSPGRPRGPWTGATAADSVGRRRPLSRRIASRWTTARGNGATVVGSTRAGGRGQGARRRRGCRGRHRPPREGEPRAPLRSRRRARHQAAGACTRSVHQSTVEDLDLVGVHAEAAVIRCGRGCVARARCLPGTRR